MYRRIFKRAGDIFLSSILLILFAPVFLIIAVCLVILNKGNVFFIQKRPGLYGLPFPLYKFQTLENKSPNFKTDTERITRFGNFLRKSSLDELPQLLNIFKGDMSFIGPRPLLMEYLPLYSMEQQKRHLVRPGLTGLAQVNGRNSISWSEKFTFDVYYVSHLSLKLDLKIMIKTFKYLIHWDNIYQNNQIPEKFNGKN